MASLLGRSERTQNGSNRNQAHALFAVLGAADSAPRVVSICGVRALVPRRGYPDGASSSSVRSALLGLSRYARDVKLLVIASEPISADDLRAVIGSDATDDAEVMVIAPALHKSALRFWLSDADQAIARAQTVQQGSVDQLESEGITVSGDTGESEPLAAIADTLEGFPADRIALFIHPQSEQSYRENITAGEITERFGLPVTVTEIKR